MVINPRNYQNLAAWSVASVIGCLYNITVAIGGALNRRGVFRHLDQAFGSQGVTHIQISKMVYELARRKYLEFDGSDSVKFTNKAKMRIVDVLAGDRGIGSKYYFISFDIPESKRAYRNKFRYAIKRMGFKQIQKSLWVSNKEVGDLVEAAAVEYEVNEYVAYFISERSNIDKYIVDLLS